MGVADLIQKFQFVVDANGEKQSVLIDYAVWEELLNLLEDLEDSEEIDRLRDAGEESIPWEQAKVELLSDEKFEALADQLADDFMNYVGLDRRPLSDYAVSREGLYEGHL